MDAAAAAALIFIGQSVSQSARRDRPHAISSAVARNVRREAQKSAQLCSQVREALSLALAAIEDDVLLDLFVLEVNPAPDSGRLRVTVDVNGGHEREHVQARLERHMGTLRAEVASAIHRKKTPTLVFEVLPQKLGA